MEQPEQKIILETASAVRSSENEGEVFLSPEEEKRMNEVFATEDLRNAFKHLVVTTTTYYLDSAIQYKRDLVLEIAGNYLPPSGVLREYPSVYIASGVDVALPLCLGARKIVMVDKAFQDDPEARDIVIDRIITITSQQPTIISDHEVSFLFDFGDDKEEVRVLFEEGPYLPYRRENKYAMPSKVAMVIQFLGQLTEIYDALLKKSVVAGGLLLSDRNPDMRDNQDFDFERQKDEAIGELYPENAQAWDFDEIYKRTFQKRGYQYIPLKSKSPEEGLGADSTLLKRLEQ